MHADTKRMETKHMGDVWASCVQVAKWAGVAAIGWYSSLPFTIWLLGICVMTDLLFGLGCAFVRQRIDSSIAFRGAVRKALTFALVLFVGWLETVINHSPDGALSRTTAGYFILVELISILENCTVIGIPIPSVMVDALVKAKSLAPRAATPEELEKLHMEATTTTKNNCHG